MRLSKLKYSATNKVLPYPVILNGLGVHRSGIRRHLSQIGVSGAQALLDKEISDNSVDQECYGPERRDLSLHYV